MTRASEARAIAAPSRQVTSTRRAGAAGSRNNISVVQGAARSESSAKAARHTLEFDVLFAAVAGLCLLGLPIVLSASAPLAILHGQSPWTYVVRQSGYLVIGVVAAVVVSRVPITTVRKFRFLLPLLALSLLVVVFVPGVGHYAGGSSRWIGIGPIQIQPSELMKLAVVIFAADLLARRYKRRDQWKEMVRPLLIFLVVAAMLIVKQPDLGTAMVLCCITYAMLFAAGVRVRYLLASGAVVCAGGAFVALSAAYSRDRLLSFLNPFAHAAGTGYQVVQAYATLGLGGLLGSGVGASATTWGFLPNAHTDFVFAVIAGNLGLVGALATLVGFAAIGWAGFRIAARERDPFARFVAVGVTCWVIAQAVINIGGVVDALPVTGIPLPFISYGGSSLVVALIGVGLLFGIARRQSEASSRSSAPARFMPVPARPAANRSRSGRRPPRGPA
ncbi:MAG: putative lipid II flippase FtsW [Acidimicrobiales bacterium]|jgi:cell division protein FtsW